MIFHFFPLSLKNKALTKDSNQRILYIHNFKPQKIIKLPTFPPQIFCSINPTMDRLGENLKNSIPRLKPKTLIFSVPSHIRTRSLSYSSHKYVLCPKSNLKPSFIRGYIDHHRCLPPPSTRSLPYSSHIPICIPNLTQS